MPYPPGSPANANMCVLYGYVRGLDDVAKNGAIVRLSAAPRTQGQAENSGSASDVFGVGVTVQALSITTDSDGWFEQNVRKGVDVLIEIPAIRMHKIVRVPDEDSGDVETVDLIPAPNGVLNEVVLA